jgi:hypothetical protein
MKTISESEAIENPTLSEAVNQDSQMKSWIVNYVGSKQSADIQGITVGMIVETMAQEFPEFLMAVAEENWVRGYHQALEDVDAGRRAELAERDNDQI